MLDMLAQFLSAFLPMLTTLDGMTMGRNKMHWENANSPKPVTDVGMATERKYVQFAKARASMAVTLALI